MTEINANLVRTLRQATGLGMMDCKKALVETSGDVEKAKEWLRKKGLSNANKKSDRATAEGVVAIASNKKSVAVIELNSETDFVAKNEKFIALADTIAEAALNSQTSITELPDVKTANGNAIADLIVENIAALGENIKLTRVDYLNATENGIVDYYIHNAFSKTCGKIGVAVAIESDKKLNDTSVNALAKQIAMHIAATKPSALDIASLDQEYIEKEKAIVAEQARASGKPENVIEKMIEGRMRKFFEEVVLLEQAFVVNSDKKVSTIVADFSKDLNCTLKVSGYIRFGLNS